MNQDEQEQFWAANEAENQAQLERLRTHFRAFREDHGRAPLKAYVPHDLFVDLIMPGLLRHDEETDTYFLDGVLVQPNRDLPADLVVTLIHEFTLRVEPPSPK